MNEHVRPAALATRRPVTRAAEGLPRWSWTTAEIERLVALRVLDEHERIELIGGEIVPMSPVGQRHVRVAERMQRRFLRSCGSDVWVVEKPQFNLDANTYTEPDLLAFPAAMDSYDVRGPQALLVVEVADSSLDYDLGEKASLYARYGVREYWVVEAWELVTTVHRSPGPGGYGDIARHLRDQPITPLLMPHMSVRLAEIGLD